MVGFILIICTAALIGIQLGVYSVLKMKGISSSRSFFYTFIFYLMPVVLIIAHVRLFRERHDLFKEAKKSLRLTEAQYRKMAVLLDKKTFIFVVVIGGMIDIITFRDNLKILIEFAVEYDKKVLVKNTIGNRNLFQQVGIIGVLTKVFGLVSDEMKEHALEETLVKRYAF